MTNPLENVLIAKMGFFRNEIVCGTTVNLGYYFFKGLKSRQI